jgi:hypothetical protein
MLFVLCTHTTFSKPDSKTPYPDVYLSKHKSFPYSIMKSTKVSTMLVSIIRSDYPRSTLSNDWRDPIRRTRPLSNSYSRTDNINSYISARKKGKIPLGCRARYSCVARLRASWTADRQCRRHHDLPSSSSSLSYKPQFSQFLQGPPSGRKCWQKCR